MFTAKQIRQKFLDFFANKGHLIVPSAPLVIKDDPTLMFTNAGMNQFKDYFLGNEVPPAVRIADTQKCLRVSGKHNDLDEVGIDTYHHTMFEMLGNWSFGDYFKKEAVAWAWELLTQVYELPADRLYATVFEGSPQENIPVDNEAAQYWENFLPSERIIFASKKDNFWEMGDIGPCGPCSEIHIDLRSDSERAAVDGLSLVNQDHPLVVEIWNLVFIQYNRKANKTLEKLPQSHVDTGMGLERLIMAIQHKHSNYDTDLFSSLIEKVCSRAGVQYGANEQTDIAVRVIVDHIRAVSFAITDGLLPSNNKAGYVIRRILRRAVRYGYHFLNFKKPFLCELAHVLAEENSDIFPELQSQIDFITKVLCQEETNFLYTLEKGLILLQKHIDKLAKKKQSALSGEVAFELYDTFGFPYDLVKLILREKGLSVEKLGFDKSLEMQKERSRKATQMDTNDWIVLKENNSPTQFVGYDQLSTPTQIYSYRKVKEKSQTFYQLLLSDTPFYPEGGGQLGDKGTLSSSTENIEVFDTKKENNVILHHVRQLPQAIDEIFEAKVDENVRRRREQNHTATHLLQASLRQHLGNHVIQRGSLVSENELRFDFSHPSKISQEEIQKIENTVNAKIRSNISKDEKRNYPIEKAKAMGAMALFGEKYGDQVRVIIFDSDYSVELCGGTHVSSTGQIGFFKIVSEASVASGVRRIQAFTGQRAEIFVWNSIIQLQTVQELLKSPKNIPMALEKLLQENQELHKKVEASEKQKLQAMVTQIKEKAIAAKDFSYIIEQVKLPQPALLRSLCFSVSRELQSHLDQLAIVLVTVVNHKPHIAVHLSKSLIEKEGWHAGNIAKELAKEIQGGGGGQEFFATAGGGDATKIKNVIRKAKTILDI